uniref:Tetratricopeptide repeat protein n=1 Tax=uncultured organism TaxID=155900 RepID=M1QAK0_9ZZZZ|nr:hypothetical protein FLSS-6_0018 [uncultured organism]
MAGDLQSKVEEHFEHVPIQLDMELETEGWDFQVTDEMERLMERVEKADQPFRLYLDDPELYLKFCIVRLKKRDHHGAEEWAKKSLDMEKSYEGLVCRANALSHMGDYKSAMKYYDDALDLKEDPRVYRYKAEALIERGMKERALNPLEEALKLKEGKSAELWAMCGDILVDLGREKEAKKSYEKVSELDQGNTRMEEKIEELLEEAERQSLPDQYNNILRLDRTCVPAWLGKASKYWNMGEQRKAIRCLNKAKKYLEEGSKRETITDRIVEYRKDLMIIKDCPECEGTGGCPGCDGTGDCELCQGTGDCPDCEGTGDCLNCEGTGECPDCEGTGKTGLFSECETCGGTGYCQECEGYGICEACEGTGNCQRCGGSGNCGECQGSGECGNCDGEGKIERRKGDT